MPRPKQMAITERQFEALNVLWEHGPLTVREVRDRLPCGKELPYTTVLGLLQVMEQAGLVTHEAENKTYRYRPLISRRQGTRRLLADFVQRFFSGAAEKLVLGLIESRQLSMDDLRGLEAKLAETADVEAPDNSAAKSDGPKRGRRKP